MAKEWLTDEQVEQEIERLKASEAVKLARKEQRLKYKYRQKLYTLRVLEKRGRELMKQGVTLEALDILETSIDEDEV